MTLLTSFGKGLHYARKVRGLTQEDFASVSSRTYLSSLERGLKGPTITKVDQLASVLEIHPVSLLALAYVARDGLDARTLLDRILLEIIELGERN